jgi:ribonuclease VapC
LIDGLADAFIRYGKGSSSAARLNLGDCISYAMARRAGVALLYKGDDFAATDLG